MLRPGDVDGLFSGQQVARALIEVHRLELLIGKQTQGPEIDAGLRPLQGLDGLIGLAAVRRPGVDDEVPVHAARQRVEVDVVVRDLPEHVLMKVAEPLELALVVLHDLAVTAVALQQFDHMVCREAVIEFPVDGAEKARRGDLLRRLRHERAGLRQFIAMGHLEREAVRGRHALQDVFVEDGLEEADVVVNTQVVPHVVRVQPADGDRVAIHALREHPDSLGREILFEFRGQEVDEFRQVVCRHLRDRAVRLVVHRLLFFLIGTQDPTHVDALAPAQVAPDQIDLTVEDVLQFRHLVGVFREDVLQLFVVPERHIEVRQVLVGIPVLFEDRLFEGRPVRPFFRRVFGDVLLPVVIPHLLFGLRPQVLHIVLHEPLEHAAVVRHRSHLLL